MTKLRLRSKVNFPATVTGTGGIGVSKTGGIWEIEPAWEDLAVLTSLSTPETKEIWSRDPATAIYNRIAISALIAAVPPGPTGATGAAGAPGSPGANGAGYGGTSTTSLAIAVATKVFTTQAGLAYTNGARVRASSAANAGNYMEGVVAYSGTTLTMTVDATGGSGTLADWNFNIVGQPAVSSTGTYATIAALQAATVPAGFNTVTIERYSTSTPICPARWKRISTPGVVKTWHKQSTDGAYWQLADARWQPQMLGAFADDATDDYQTVLDTITGADTTGNRVYLTGLYYGATSWKIVNLAQSSLIIEGSGTMLAQLRSDQVSVPVLWFANSSNATSSNWLTLRNFSIHGASATGKIGLKLEEAKQYTIDNIWTHATKSHGIQVGSDVLASGTASITLTTMTVTGSPTGAYAVGQTISGVNVTGGTTITALGTGTGGAGTYTVSISQTAASATVTASLIDCVAGTISNCRCAPASSPVAASAAFYIPNGSTCFMYNNYSSGAWPYGLYSGCDTLGCFRNTYEGSAVAVYTAGSDFNDTAAYVNAITTGDHYVVGATTDTWIIGPRGTTRSQINVAAVSDAKYLHFDLEQSGTAVQTVTGGTTGQVPVSAGTFGVPFTFANFTPGAWTAWTPTLSTTGGSGVTLSADVAQYAVFGKTIFYNIAIRCTVLGTGSGQVTFSLPITADASQYITTGFNAARGVACLARFNAVDATHASVYAYDSTYPFSAAPQVIFLTGFYQTT